MSNSTAAPRPAKVRPQLSPDLVVEPGIAAGLFTAEEALKQALRPKPATYSEDEYDAITAGINAQVERMRAEDEPVIAAKKAEAAARRASKAEAKSKRGSREVQRRTVQLDRPETKKDFPLFPDASGRWRKKVRGKAHYFGKFADDPKGERAIQLWLDQKDALLAGRKPRPAVVTGPTLRELCNRFLGSKEGQRDAGDIRSRTFDDYLATCKTLTKLLDADRPLDDFAADDFEQLRAALAKRLNPNSLGNEIGRVRVLFQYALDIDMLARPMRFGPTFKRPAKRVLRAIRQKQGPRMFEAADIRTILDAADVPMKAMILLGVNCGFGNTDCGSLPKAALDLKRGWVDFPRPKTAVPRRCPLWPETVAALKVAIAERQEPKSPEDDRLVFVTKYGQPWAKDSKASPLSAEFRKLLNRIDADAAKDAKEHGVKAPAKIYRRGLGFYALRHVFETIGGGSRDQVALNALMGHVDSTMASVYRERIDDDRLVAVTEHVRNWLFPRPNVK